MISYVFGSSCIRNRYSTEALDWLKKLKSSPFEREKRSNTLPYSQGQSVASILDSNPFLHLTETGANSTVSENGA